MRHFANPSFWECYRKLPRDVQKLADENFKLLKRNPRHPSLHLKKVGKYWSARVGIKYRTVAVEVEEGLVWFWIGTHAEYDKLIQSPP
jgi:mRNA-degrading endonuclease RelE of RelBE toxin-antitoxin system